MKKILSLLVIVIGWSSSLLAQEAIDNDTLVKPNIMASKFDNSTSRNKIIYNVSNKELSIPYQPLPAKPLGLEPESYSNQNFIKLFATSLNGFGINSNYYLPTFKGFKINSTLNFNTGCTIALTTGEPTYVHRQNLLKVVAQREDSKHIQEISVYTNGNKIIAPLWDSTSIIARPNNAFIMQEYGFTLEQLFNKNKEGWQFIGKANPYYINRNNVNSITLSFQKNVEDVNEYCLPMDLFFAKKMGDKSTIALGAQLQFHNLSGYANNINNTYYAPTIKYHWQNANKVLELDAAGYYFNNSAANFTYNFNYNVVSKTNKLKVGVQAIKSLINTTARELLNYNILLPIDMGVITTTPQLPVGNVSKFAINVQKSVGSSMLLTAEGGLKYFINAVDFYSSYNKDYYVITNKFLNSNYNYVQLGFNYRPSKRFNFITNIEGRNKVEFMHVPTLQLNTILQTYFTQTTFWNVNYTYTTGRRDFTSDKLSPINLNISDLSSDIQFKLYKQLSFFAGVYNILNNANPYSTNYNAYQRNYAIGLVYRGK